MDWDLGLFPDSAGKSIAFNHLLDNLRSVHEEVCARNTFLETELTRNGIHGISERKEDQWLPSNFLAPKEGPPPRLPPKSICALSTQSTCTPRSQTSDILVRQQENLSQSIDNLAEQQGYLAEQQGHLTEQQGYLTEQITKVIASLNTMPKPVVPKGILGKRFSANSRRSKDDVEKDGRTSMAMQLSFSQRHSSDRPTITRFSEPGDESQRVAPAKVQKKSIMAVFGGRDKSVVRDKSTVRERSLIRATMKFALRVSERGKKPKKRWSIESEEPAAGPYGALRFRLHKLIRTTAFTSLSGLIIFAYAVTIAIETNMLSEDPDMESTPIAILHIVFNCTFCVELMIRFIADGWSTWCGEDAIWNRLDLFFILCAFTELIMEAATSQIKAGSASSIARAMRIFRVFRTMRMIRSLRHFYEFQKMAYAVLSSFKTLVCSLALLAFVMFFFAVWFTQSAADFQQRVNIQNLDLRYGDLMSTAYTLFMSISGGISWDECYMPLFDLNVWTAQGFIVYIALVYFGVLNIVTSVFVESVTRSLQQHKDIIVKDKEEEKKIAMVHVKELFKQVDGDGSGNIGLDEMEHFLEDSKLAKYMEALDIEVDDTRLLFRLLDCDGSGQVNVEEFCEGCLKLKGSAKSVDLAALTFKINNFFVKWSEFTGYVEETFQEIRHALPKKQDRLK